MRNRNLQLLVFFILAFFQLACGQGSPISGASKPETVTDYRYDNLLRNLEELNQSFLKNDFDKLVDFMYLPKSFVTANGEMTEEKKIKIVATIKEEITSQNVNGLKLSVKFEQPEKIVGGDGKLFSIIRKTTIVTVLKGAKDVNGESLQIGRHELKGFNVAVSDDNGRNWLFWEKVSPETFKTAFPEAAKSIVLPEVSKLVFIPEQ
jgi:hypothetical protein